jgi:hypothetical protein
LHQSIGKRACTLARPFGQGVGWRGPGLCHKGLAIGVGRMTGPGGLNPNANFSNLRPVLVQEP